MNLRPLASPQQARSDGHLVIFNSELVMDAGRRSDASSSPEHDADSLPPAQTARWVPRQKAAVVAAVRGGALTLQEARKRYRLTEEEFLSWQESLDRDGLDGLRSSMVAERRRTPRRDVEEASTVLLSAGQVDCVIRDIGAQGARLEFRAPISTPRTFELKCERSGRTSWVSVIWQRGKSMGVRFEAPLAGRTARKPSIGDWLLGAEAG
jgi:hypothetical protein